jgi:hypothetical protein
MDDLPGSLDGMQGSGVQVPQFHHPPTIDFADEVHVSLERRGLPVPRPLRIGCLVVVGRWLGLGLVRPAIRQGTHEVVGGALHWPWCQKFDGS